MPSPDKKSLKDLQVNINDNMLKNKLNSNQMPVSRKLNTIEKIQNSRLEPSTTMHKNHSGYLHSQHQSVSSRPNVTDVRHNTSLKVMPQSMSRSGDRIKAGLRLDQKQCQCHQNSNRMFQMNQSSYNPFSSPRDFPIGDNQSFERFDINNDHFSSFEKPFER